MPDASHAILSEHDGRAALLFTRVLAYPPERVWQALTTGEGLRDWHPTPFELHGDPPAPGSPIKFIPTPDGPEMPDGQLLAYDPPRLLAHTWGEDELRWELESHQDGCLLRLTHNFDDRFKAARDATGWHLCLDALSSCLDQAPRPQRGTGTRLPQAWPELNREYQQRFGIAPEQATPPPAKGAKLLGAQTRR
jgi:uncharacterized protein YndB with AHSA1/START domain